MKKQRTEIRKEQLIRGVLNVLASEGARKLSVARVSAELGLVPSALYRHFRSKDDMLSAVLDYIESRVTNNIREVCEETEDAVERLHRILFRQLKLIKESPALPRVVFGFGVFSEHATRRMKVRNIFTQFKLRLQAIVAAGQAAGRIRTDAPAETLALMLIGLFQPAAFMWHLSNGRYDPAAHGRRAWRLYQDMIRPQQSEGVFTKGRKRRKS